MIKISIITPSYNQGKYLEETISSVVGQQYPNLEYIIIDGGSTDNSKNIIKRHEKKIAYWVSEEDNGQTDAINKGLKIITGEIWAYICSDDVYNHGAFSKCFEVFSNNPNVDVIYGNCNFTNAKGMITRFKRPPVFDRKILLKNNFIYQPSVFLRSCVIKEFGYFDDKLDFGMDYEYWLRISKYKKPQYVDFNFSNYRLHLASKSIKSNVKQQRDVRDIRIKYGIGINAHISFLRFIVFGKYYYLLKRLFFEIMANINRGYRFIIKPFINSFK